MLAIILKMETFRYPNGFMIKDTASNKWQQREGSKSRQ